MKELHPQCSCFTRIRSAHVVLVLTVFLVCGSVVAQRRGAPAKRSQGPAQLVLNLPEKREIAPNQTHNYAFTLKAGEYANVVVRQLSTYVEVFLRNPNGLVVADLESHEIPESLMLHVIGPAAGTYRIEVHSRVSEDSGPGNYRIALNLIRRPTAEDTAAAQAMELYRAARELHYKKAEESENLAIEKYIKALALFRTAGDDSSESRTIEQIADLYNRTGQNSKLGDIVGETFSRRLKKYGAKNRSTAAAAKRYAMFEEDHGDRARAAYLYERSREILEELPPDPDAEPEPEGRSAYSLFGPTKLTSPIVLTQPAKSDSATLMTQIGHSSFVRSVAFSPDGRFAVSGAEDNTARLWEVATGKELRRFEGHTKAILAVAYSPNGNLIATASRDCTVYVWQASTGRKVLHIGWWASFKGAFPTSVSFSADSKYLFTANEDDTVRVWDIAKGAQIKYLEVPMLSTTSLAYSPDGNLIAVGSSDAAVHIWDPKNKTEVFRLAGAESRIEAVAFSPDGQRVAAADYTGGVFIWSLEGQHQLTRTAGHKSPVVGIGFSNDQVVTASWDRTIRFWNATTGAEIRKIVLNVPPFSLAVSRDGDQIFFGDINGVTHMLRASDGNEIKKFERGSYFAISSVSVSNDGRRLLAGSSRMGGAVTLFDIPSGQVTRQIKITNGYVSTLAFATDGESFVVATGDKYGDAMFSHFSEGGVYLVRPGKTEAEDTILSVDRLDNPAAAAIVSPDGKTIAGAVGRGVGLSPIDGPPTEDFAGRPVLPLSGALAGPSLVLPAVSSSASQDLAITTLGSDARVWNVQTGSAIASFKGHSAAVSSASLSKTNRLAVTGSLDKTARLWEVATGRELHRFETPAEVLGVAISPDEQTVLTAGVDGMARLWDVNSGRELRQLNHTGQVTSAIFSPDGRYALTSSRGFVMIGGLKSRDTTPHLWDISSGKEVRRFEGAVAEISAVAASRDGNFVVTGGFANSIDLWSTRGRLVRTLAGHTGGVTSLSISRDSDLILSTGYDNCARLWNAETGAEVQKYCGHTRTVTSAALSPDHRFVVTSSYNAMPDYARMEEGMNGPTHETLFQLLETQNESREALASDKDAKPVRVWDAKSGVELRDLKGLDDAIMAVAISPDGHFVAAGGAGQAMIWNLEDGTVIHKLSVERDDGIADLTYSSDGRYLLAGLFKGVAVLWDAKSGTILRKFADSGEAARSGAEVEKVPTIQASPIRMAEPEAALRFEGRIDRLTPVALSRDDKYVIVGSPDGRARLHDMASGKLITRFEKHSDAIASVAFSSDGNFVLTGGQDAMTNVWQRESGRRLATMISFLDHTWAVLNPEGRFDCDDLETVSGLHWLVPDSPFAALPIELLMRDYYEPSLFARTLAGEKFSSATPIAGLNRAEPQVRIVKAEPQGNDAPKVLLTLEIGRGTAEIERNGNKQIMTTGVYDLRIFRDGQLVRTWPADGAEKLISLANNQAAGSAGTGSTSREVLAAWRKAYEIKPDENVKVDPHTGKMTLTFIIPVPRSKDLSQIGFTAYAYNEDRVKTPTTRWTWPSEAASTLPQAQPVKRKAFILTVGVNAYENPEWDLKYAANDARQVQKTLSESLAQGREYDEIVPVSLISDYQVKGTQSVVTEKSATKANVKAVLDLLSGRSVDTEIIKEIPNADKLRTATPDDLVLISFSSHGYADAQGNFFFIPYDVGAGKGRAISADLLRHAISSEELSLWLRDVDAGDIVMIVDACHSAASVQGPGFKAGPMGSRGLGQLSYDKGIRILTSTQSDDVALETDFTQQGLLTYALTREGIEGGEADFKPRDKQITVAEWLEFGVDRVPRLYDEIQRKFASAALSELKSIDSGPNMRTKVVVFSRDVGDSSFKKGSGNQQPSLFDFTRKRTDVTLVRNH